MLRASMMYAFGRAYGLPYKMATIHSKRRVIQYGLLSQGNEKPGQLLEYQDFFLNLLFILLFYIFSNFI